MTLQALSCPAPAESKVAHADWLELSCLFETSKRCSVQDLVREFRRSGTVGPVAVVGDKGSVDSQRIAEDAFLEVEGRATACGKERYPFDVSAHSLVLRDGFERSPYTFQLLLSQYGLVHKKGSPSPEKLFEELAALAAAQYFGGDEHSSALAFGFPRRYEAKNFRQALDHLCAKVGEGSAIVCGTDAAGLAKAKRFSEQKDGKLDIVAWRSFPDGRGGKLIGFGQCAAGEADWRSKMSELQPSAFMQLWMRDHFLPSPIRMFFVPRRIDELDWTDVAIQAGLLFDRCRITHNATKAPTDILDECEGWVRHVLKGPTSVASVKTKRRRSVPKRVSTGRTAK